MNFVMIAGGRVQLYFGAEWLVSGASRLARSLRISQLTVGLTVVASGTSAPEVVVGIASALMVSSAFGVVVLRKERTIERRERAALLTCYVAFMAFTIGRA